MLLVAGTFPAPTTTLIGSLLYCDSPAGRCGILSLAIWHSYQVWYLFYELCHIEVHVGRSVPVLYCC